MTKYGQSPWLTEFPKSRVPSYPKYRGDGATDVVIVGGGLAGCAIAYTFAAAGIKTTLLEAGRIGQGYSACSTGWIADDPGANFSDVEKLLGRRAARRAWQVWRRAALDFSALLRRLDIKCHLEAHPSLLIASTPEQAVRLKREHKARKEAGFEQALVNNRTISSEVAVPAAAGLRTRDGFSIDPYRAALGLAAAAAARGASLFEKSPVKRITFGRRTADVHLADGKIRANRVVIATGVPNALSQSLARHFWFRTYYLALTDRVPATIRKQLGKRQAIVRDSAEPPHVVRWVGDDQLLITGADGDQLPDRQRDKVLVQRTGQLMYELSTIYPDISGIQPQFGWDLPYTKTADGLPSIGPHRNYPHHLFAFGGAPHAVTGAYLASRILLRYHMGEPEASDEVFAFRLEERS